jgi:CheY-like chemotaxis protein
MGVRRRGDQVSIEVWDTGRGIPDNQMHAIFQDFHQIDNEERDRSKGLGLGLAIAERLAICLSHEIACDSRIGKGSRFAVLVTPAQEKTAVATKTKDLNLMLQGLSGRRILLVEDDLEVLKATRQLMESWGCIVVQATNFEEALTAVNAQPQLPPELILADNRLPGGVEGVVVASRVREIFGYTIPSIIVTGDVQDDHLKEIASHGYRVMAKPVQPAKLRSLLSSMLENTERKPGRGQTEPFKLHSV